MSDSSSRLQPVRGTHDLLPRGHAPPSPRRARPRARSPAATASRRSSTPIFEFTEVFKRTLGDTSDVVTKEMYTLRPIAAARASRCGPENTAGVCRALISNGLTQDLPLKFFYAGPMFRYERPQKGRQRQFHQIGIELLGVPEPQGDVEVIACGAQILDALGVAERHDARDQHAGRRREPHGLSRGAGRRISAAHQRQALGRTAAMRLERNPLRILDSKDEGDRAHRRRRAALRRPPDTEAARSSSPRCATGCDALGIAYTLQPAPGARARLLLPHRLRVHDRRRSARRAR